MAYEKTMATASVTIVDETESSTLTGNMLVVKGSKNQIFISGQDNPFSPDWTKNNLVIRPFLQASNITKETVAGEEYNPDLFSPEEYPSGLSTYDYIKDIHWYLRDGSGVETELYDSNNYGFSYTYSTAGGNVTCSDSRQIVIKNNILGKNSSADLVCKFSFYDPFTFMTVSQKLEINIINLASGQTNSKLVTTCINGNAITNNGDGYIDIVANYYGELGNEDIDSEIASGNPAISCLWFIRKSGNWTLLDPTQTGHESANATANMYQYMKVTNYDSVLDKYEFENIYNTNGSSSIRIYPAAIAGSEVIKCVYVDSASVKFNSIQLLTDATDDNRVVFHFSNGKRLRKGVVDNTTIKANVIYKGALLEEDSPLYDTLFAYHWYKYTLADDKYVNVYNNNMNDLIENEDLENPIAGTRSLFIDHLDISNIQREAEIILDLVDKEAIAAKAAQANFYSMAITEDDLNTAIVANSAIGVSDDLEAAMVTAQELNAE